MIRRFERWAPAIDFGLISQMSFTIKVGPLDNAVIISGVDEDGTMGLDDPKHLKSDTKLTGIRASV